MKHRIKRYHLGPEGKGAVGAAALMGIAFFLRCMFYFGFTRTETVGVGELLVWLILPMLLEAAFMVLLRGIKLDAARIYGILGVVYSILLVLQCIGYGSLLRMILGIIAYVICGGSLLAASFGWLNKDIAFTFYFVTAVVRVVFDLKPYIFEFHPVLFMKEAAGLCGVFALCLLAFGLKLPKE